MMAQAMWRQGHPRHLLDLRRVSLSNPAEPVPRAGLSVSLSQMAQLRLPVQPRPLELQERRLTRDPLRLHELAAGHSLDSRF